MSRSTDMAAPQLGSNPHNSNQHWQNQTSLDQISLSQTKSPRKRQCSIHSQVSPQSDRDLTPRETCRLSSTGPPTLRALPHTRNQPEFQVSISNWNRQNRRRGTPGLIHSSLSQRNRHQYRDPSRSSQGPCLRPTTRSRQDRPDLCQLS